MSTKISVTRGKERGVSTIHVTLRSEEGYHVLLTNAELEKLRKILNDRHRRQRRKAGAK